jgi:hypothetical protein
MFTRVTACQLAGVIILVPSAVILYIAFFRFLFVAAKEGRKALE